MGHDGRADNLGDQGGVVAPGADLQHPRAGTKAGDFQHHRLQPRREERAGRPTVRAAPGDHDRVARVVAAHPARGQQVPRRGLLSYTTRGKPGSEGAVREVSIGRTAGVVLSDADGSAQVAAITLAHTARAGGVSSRCAAALNCSLWLRAAMWSRRDARSDRRSVFPGPMRSVIVLGASSTRTVATVRRGGPCGIAPSFCEDDQRR